jgi:hypothetical protein
MIKGYTGSSALEYFSDSTFIEQWDYLFNNCYWATAFQDRRYVYSWYTLYQLKYEPLLLVSYEEDTITGIFPLALTDDNKIVGAGHHQAEYKCWISTEKTKISFIVEAIEWLRMNYPDWLVNLSYLPNGIPYNELKNDTRLSEYAIWRIHQQPIMVIDEEMLLQQIKKKNRKEKINRLKRIGDLKFEKVESNEEFRSVLDELIIQNDFRKGAVYGNEFFANDPLKKEFKIQLFSLGLLHVTILKLNEEIIASNASIHGKGVVHLAGFNTHSPFYSKYSPGIIRFLMLGLLIHKEGYYEFDLTPGGIEGYKSDLATDYKNVYELIIASGLTKIRLDIIARIKAVIIKQWPDTGLSRFRYLKDLVKNQANHLAKMLKYGPVKYYRKKALLSEPISDFLLYPLYRNAFEYEKSAIPIRINLLDDLLLYSQEESVLTRQDFLIDCMKRIENGHQVFTLMKDNKLMACLWYIPKEARIDYPIQSKAEMPIVFLSQLNHVDDHDLKSFINNALTSLFKNDSALEILYFKSNKNQSVARILS